MIYDCFPFFNELELLELRLHELYGVVDKFVLVEATQTHMNKPKPLYFQDNRERFAAFSDRIIHVVVRDLPQASDPWVPDRFQRNCIARGLADCRPDDWVLVSDVDEIPRAGAVATVSRGAPFTDGLLARSAHGLLNAPPMQRLFQRKGVRRFWRKNHPFVWRFGQTLYRYFLNCRSSAVWHGTRMVRFRDFSTAEETRYSGWKTVADAGWHFTWMGGIDRIRDKLAACAHQELNEGPAPDAQALERIINAGEALFDRTERLQFVEIDQSFPRYLRDHPDRFAKLLKPMPAQRPAYS